MKYLTKKDTLKCEKIFGIGLSKSYIAYSDKTLISNGINFPITLLYIYAAAGISIWKRGLSLFSACGFFMPISHLLNSDK